jgi:hypothetical protein
MRNFVIDGLSYVGKGEIFPISFVVDFLITIF